LARDEEAQRDIADHRKSGCVAWRSRSRQADRRRGSRRLVATRFIDILSMRRWLRMTDRRAIAEQRDRMEISRARSRSEIEARSTMRNRRRAHEDKLTREKGREPRWSQSKLDPRRKWALELDQIFGRRYASRSPST
jgi:hypothetical protein